MSVLGPHYLLLADASEPEEPGQWCFVLRESDGSERLVVEDIEPHVRGERLELLTVVRGLEALEQPARVTLITRSTYVREGIRYGLPEWRKNQWRWESFGKMIPVKNCDLWQRVDQALGFHQVECRNWRLDSAHRPAVRPSGANHRTNRSRAASAAVPITAAAARAGAEDRFEPGGPVETPGEPTLEHCERPQPWHRALGLGKLAMMAMGRISCLGGAGVGANLQEEHLRTA
jgi:ribonuclease HI